MTIEEANEAFDKITNYYKEQVKEKPKHKRVHSIEDGESEDDCYDYDSDEVDYNKGYQWHTKY